MPRKPDPELVYECVRSVRAGVALREVARMAGVTATTVKRWSDLAPAVLEPPGDAKPEVSVPPSPPSDPPDLGPEPPTLERARAMLAQSLALVESSEAAGNYTAAQRAMRDAAQLMPVIARLERIAGDEAGVLKLSRAEIDEAMVGVRARVEALCARPLLCAACSRAVSIEWGSDP